MKTTLTKETRANLTPSQIIDLVIEHATTQHVRSKEDDGPCLYRGPNNTKCFVGLFILDEEYHPDMERLSVNNLADSLVKSEKENPSLFSFTNINRNLLYQLQDIHDQIHPRDWLTQLTLLKNNF